MKKFILIVLTVITIVGFWGCNQDSTSPITKKGWFVDAPMAGLAYKTSSGIMVRSKSETIIDMFLHTNRIPFRYECALHLDNIILHPDFTIRHPQTGEIYYWEHFGIMDDPSYAEKALKKLSTYEQNGIFPGEQLIITFETRKNPLNQKHILNLIEHYFL